MSNKLTIAIFIISFWILFPIPMQFMGLGGFEDMQDTLNVPENPTALNYLTIMFTMVIVYFQLLVLGIPEAPLLINILLFIMKLISGLVIYLLVRGD